MKNIIYIILTLLFTASYSLYSQDELLCETALIENEGIDLAQTGGIYLTSTGNLNVLLVFARFKDDWSYHPYWDPELLWEPPQDYETWIDPDMQTGSTNFENVTHYFKDMSLGTFNVTGTAVYVETPNIMSYYGTAPNMDRHLATKEVLQGPVDDLIDYADFDNWTCNGNYDQENNPDGTIDMIVMIWRVSGHPFPFFDPALGTASLGGGTSYTVEGGTKTIKTFFGCGIGSGVTCYYWGERNPKYSFKGAIHEIGHWLLGSVHPYSQSGTDHHLLWGMLTGPGSPFCANSFERERVAWINPNVITGDILNAPLNDYVNAGTSYKYHPTNGATHEYYYFENHQKLNSDYDDVTTNQNDKGIFVIHQQNGYNSTNNIRIKTANGQWNWENPFSNNCFGGAIVPAFKKTTVNRAGRNNRDELIATTGTSYLFSLINESGVGVCGDWRLGGGLNNSFNLTYNDVFSPYSNPYTHTWNNQENDFTMEVFAQNGSTLNVKFFLDDPLEGKPSKPQNTGTVQDPRYPGLVRVTWDGNSEGDLSLYEVSRKVNTGNWAVIGTTANNYFIDEDFIYLVSGNDLLTYRIRAKDTDNNYSLYSDETSCRAEYIGKIKSKTGIEIQDYKLFSNYPNPFNPQTTIQYDVKEKGLVQLRVYDILGKEVANLVNEVKEEGSHFVVFDASDLPSGVYVYSIRVNDFNYNQKMIFMK